MTAPVTAEQTRVDVLVEAARQMQAELRDAWASGVLPAVAVSGECVRHFDDALAAFDVSGEKP